MLKTRIIPCLDVKDGRVVKGVKFLELKDAGDPVEIAKTYDKEGADELCFLDISASIESRGILYDTVASVAEQCFMPLTVGGGVRTVEDIRKLLLAGADKASINSAAITNPEIVREGATKFGSQCVVVAIDVKKNPQSGEYEIYSHGGTRETGKNALHWAKYMESLGAGEILLTSMDKDGTKSGFDIEITRLIADNLKIPVIASGGVGKPEHFVEGVRDGHASALLAASIFHFGEYKIKEVKDFMQKNGLAVRV